MIEHIEIENFKCFTERRIDFSCITVLAGANSTGKSSVIQSLLLSRIAFERAKAVDFDFSNEISIPLNGDYLLSLGNTQQIFNRESDEDVIRFRFYANRQSMKFLLQGDYVEDSIYALKLKHLRCSADLAIFSPFSAQFHYLNAERIGPRLKYEAYSFPYLSVGFQGEYSIQTLSDKNFRIEASRLLVKDLPPTLLSQSRAWLEFIVPGVRIKDANLLGRLKTAEVSFGESSPTNVGFGVSYVLPIVVAGLIAPKGCMLVVENPEAHLHPSGQSRIGQFLARIAAAGVQVVIETHSEHVINGIRITTLDGTLSPDDALVNFFSRNDNDRPHVTSIRFTPKGDLDQWPRDFFDQQQQDFAQIIRLKNQKQSNG